MTALICALSSFRLRYMWPEKWLLRFEISPSTHIVPILFSRRDFIFLVSSKMVRGEGSC